MLMSTLIGLSALLVVVCIGAAKKLTDWLDVRWRNEMATGLLRRIDDLANRVVKEVYQAYVRPNKAHGTWDVLSKQTAREDAIKLLRAYLSVDDLEALRVMLGPDTGVEAFLCTAVEDAVHDNKRAGRLAKAMVRGCPPAANMRCPIPTPA